MFTEFNENTAAKLQSMMSTKVTEVYSAPIMQDTIYLFVIEHAADLSSWAVSYNCDETDILLHIHDEMELKFAVELFPTFREAKDFYNGRVAL